MCKCYVLLLLISTLCFTICFGILVENQQQAKPAYTSGIKTTNWRNPNSAYTYHNYSKVVVHNNPTADVRYYVTQTERTVKVYPVYNGHSYGQRTENTGQVLQQTSNSDSVLEGNKAENQRNRTIYKRKIEYKVLEVYEQCPKESTGQFVYALSCNQFLNCWKGRGEPQNCAPGTLFNPKTLECDFPHKVECITGSRQNLMELREKKSVAQVSCPDNFSGLIPNYTDCSKFINCNHGQSVSMDCPPGTLFDTNQNVCDFPYKAVCFNGETGKHYQAGSQNHNYQGHYGTAQSTNLDSKLDFGTNSRECSGGGYNCHYNTGSTNSGVRGQTTSSHSTGRVQTGNTYPSIQGRCNPDIQNCGQIGTVTYGQSTQYNRNIDRQIGGSGVSSSTSYSSTTRDCNPATQNCGYLESGTNYGRQSTGYSQSAGSTYNSQSNCNPAIQNCQSGNIYGTSSSSSSTIGCNPTIQNCGQLGSATSYDQSRVYSQTGRGTVTSQTNCNPAVQNCGQLGSTTSYDQSTGYIQSGRDTTISQANCNPTIQNCDTIRTNIHYGQTTTTGCNPSTQNCGYNGINRQSGQTGSSRTPESGTYSSGVTNCNPTYQNCGQSVTNGGISGSRTYVTDQSSGYGQTGAGSSQLHNGYNPVRTNTHTVVSTVTTRCNPAIQNCGLNVQSGSSTTYNQNQGIGVTNYYPDRDRSEISGTINHHRICNIGDTSCYSNSEQHGHSQTVSTANAYGTQQGGVPKYGTQQGGVPKCPQGFQGITKHPTDCKKFLNCANGQTFIQDCAPGTLFNPKIGNCDFPYNVDCQNTQEGYVGVGEEKHTQNVGHNGDNSLEESTTTVNQYYNNRDRYPWQTHGQTGNYYQPTTKKYITPNNIDDVTEGPNPIQTNNNLDYVDVFNPDEKSFDFRPSTTPKSAVPWPPPFPSGKDYDDYDFEYDDGEPVTIEPDNVFRATQKKSTICDRHDFHCSANQCISNTMVCDGVRDCDNGKDEYSCEEYVGRFSINKQQHLEVLEKQKWINISSTTCALMCIQNTQFNCRSFNYRRNDRTCFLSDVNVGLTGALRSNYLFDYFELKTGTVVCTDRTKYFECTNKKCILKSQICDGFDDCGDRADEKNCRKEDFGYSLRLVGSKDKHEGTIQVTAFGKTGYICDDQFGIQDANVVCKELGFELGAAEAKGQSYFYKNLSKHSLYMMDDLECYGNETSLIHCDFAGWGVHNCGDMEAAGVVCKTPQEQCGYGYWRCDTGNECIPNSFICDGVFDCTDNSDEYDTYCEAPTEIRLVNGTSHDEGRLEIRHHGVWGTICDDDFNEDAAKVVCKHLGFKGRSVVKKDGYFGSGDGPIWLDQVSCYGNETTLEKCTHWNWGEHNCDHSEDVGVKCSNDIREVDVQRNSKYTGGTKTTGSGTGLKVEKCGFRKDNQFLDNDLIHARVVSGTTAQKGDYPWQAAIRVKVKENSAHWCGAVILSNKWVITAAHCLQGYAKGAYIIVAGEYNTDETEGTEQQKYIEDYFIHEKFRKGHKMNNDIALIKLKGGGFDLNQDIQPICLPDSDTQYKDLNCTISGFGSVKSGTSGYSHNMMAAWIPTHSDEVCKMPHIYGAALTEGMFCAGFLEGGVDACDGDSGGPLACLDRGVFTLYGITSWGQHCGYANKPGVYVKVAYYRNWIDDIINKHS